MADLSIQSLPSLGGVQRLKLFPPTTSRNANALGTQKTMAHSKLGCFLKYALINSKQAQIQIFDNENLSSAVFPQTGWPFALTTFIVNSLFRAKKMNWLPMSFHLDCFPFIRNHLTSPHLTKPINSISMSFRWLYADGCSMLTFLASCCTNPFCPQFSRCWGVSDKWCYLLCVDVSFPAELKMMYEGGRNALLSTEPCKQARVGDDQKLKDN